MKYQLVLQFPESIMSYEAIDKLESILALQEKADLDGHDIGSGEVNFFVLTNEPEAVFNKIIGLLNEEFRNKMKAAYRETAGELYFVLWPKNLKEFQVK